MTKRFRVHDWENCVVFKADTTEEVFQWLKKQDLGLASFRIECLVDDIEIDSEEFMQAFYDGECPGDLQFF